MKCHFIFTISQLICHFFYGQKRRLNSDEISILFTLEMSQSPTIIFNLGDRKTSLPCFHSYQTTHKHSNITVRFHFRKKQKNRNPKETSIHPSFLHICSSPLSIELADEGFVWDRGSRRKTVWGFSVFVCWNAKPSC